MAIDLNRQQINHLLTYIDELTKWNSVYNLSAVKDPLDMVSRHILDSLSLYSLLAQQVSQSAFHVLRLIDIGTGAGLPGIPLAIACPEAQFTLLDSNGKKTRFLFHVSTILQLTNTNIENQRVEDFQPGIKFDIVLSRAFASINDMIGCSYHLLNEGGRFWAMKGVYPEHELRQVSGHYNVEQCYPLSVPECTAARHLVVIA